MSFEDLKLAYARNLKFINPTIFSILALLVSLEAGYYFIDANRQNVLYIWIIVLLLFRLLIDWTGKAVINARGEENSKSKSVYYQIADKYSELFIAGGFMISRLTNFYLGFFGFISAILVMFTGMLGRAEGVDYAKQGPMCKVGRTILIIITVLVQYLGYKYGRPFMIFDLDNNRVFSWMDLGMCFFIVLCQLTIFIRLLAIRKQVKEDETKIW